MRWSPHVKGWMGPPAVGRGCPISGLLIAVPFQIGFAVASGADAGCALPCSGEPQVTVAMLERNLLRLIDNFHYSDRYDI